MHSTCARFSEGEVNAVKGATAYEDLEIGRPTN